MVGGRTSGKWFIFKWPFVENHCSFWIPSDSGASVARFPNTLEPFPTHVLQSLVNVKRLFSLQISETFSLVRSLAYSHLYKKLNEHPKGTIKILLSTGSTHPCVWLLCRLLCFLPPALHGGCKNLQGKVCSFTRLTVLYILKGKDFSSHLMKCLKLYQASPFRTHFGLPKWQHSAGGLSPFLGLSLKEYPTLWKPARSLRWLTLEARFPSPPQL